MRAFTVTIRQAGRKLRFSAIARCSMDALVCCLDCLDADQPFSACVNCVKGGGRHG